MEVKNGQGIDRPKVNVLCLSLSVHASYKVAHKTILPLIASSDVVINSVTEMTIL